MTSSTVLLERRGPAAWLTLNRPDKLNAMNSEMVRELRERLEAIEDDETVKVVVLTGAGRAFSAGYDISEEVTDRIVGAEQWRSVLAVDVELAMQLWALSRPTIAAVRGWCLAGACELAMACDMIVATSDARFGEPEIRYGSGPVALLMPFMLGQKKTNELLFTGDTIGADEAHRCGLVNRVVEPADLEAAVEELVIKIAPTPLPILRLTKLALVRAYEAMGLRSAVASNLDLSAILNAAETPEQHEFDGIVAKDGLKAALRWRDSRYGQLGDQGQ
ncbi:MAG TPA: enoyl-CoA hydratase/isomerase family protein [Candidatus Micrarchaeaceae archaeon]|nr:enoyl-CoA hydratase/isomerase family protein [Candidatus Micrarchaeaceae archaeon]